MAAERQTEAAIVGHQVLAFCGRKQIGRGLDDRRVAQQPSWNSVAG